MKRIILAFVVLGGMLVPVGVMPPVAYAADSASKTAACDGIGLTGADCGGTSAQKSVSSIVNAVVNLLSVIVGIAAIIMIIISGFKYITSGGESNSVAGAKSTLMYAIVGLVIVALAQFIVHFVLTNVVK